MTTVIDVGCARYGNDYSVERLIEEFDPNMVYGFDPAATADILHLNMGNLDPVTFDLLPPNGPSIHIRQEAAWLYDGVVGFLADGLSSKVSEDHDHWPKVRCFDLAAFIQRLDDRDIVLKLDAEGSEYPLLAHLIETETDKLLRLLLVEWHCSDCGRGGAERIGHRPGCSEPVNLWREQIEQRLACEYQEWNW